MDSNKNKAKLPTYKVQKGYAHPTKRNTLITKSTISKSNLSGCQNTNDVNDEKLPIKVPFTNDESRKAKYIRSKSNKGQIAVQKRHHHGLLVKGKLQTPRCSISSENQQGSNGKKYLGPPVIVDTLSKDISCLHIPDILTSTTDISSENKEPCTLQCFTYNSEVIASQIIIGQSINPSNSNIQHQHQNSVELESTSKDNTEKDPNNHSQNINVSSTSNILSQRIGRTLYSKMDNTSNSCMNNVREMIIHDKASQDTSQSQQAPQFYVVRNRVIVIMEQNVKFSFVGKLIVKVLYGGILVYGSTITKENSPVEVYSPRGYSSVTIETSNKPLQSEINDVWLILSAEGLNSNAQSEIQKVVNQTKSGIAIIMLTNLENNLTRFLNIFCPFRLFPKIRNLTNYSWTDPKRAEVTLQSNFYFNSSICKELIIDLEMLTAVTNKIVHRYQLKEWCCTLVAGGKGVGKSTTVKYIINSLLPMSEKVILIDLDPGQAECTPCGCISYSVIHKSLLGPNFTHLNVPVYQLYIGDINVVNILPRYIEAVRILIEKLLSSPELSSLPIIVNTMGFTHGIGWDIAVFIIKLIRPFLVLQIMSNKSKNNFDNNLSSAIVNEQVSRWTLSSDDTIPSNHVCHDLEIVQSQAEYVSLGNVWNMEPYQKRELVMISYFSGLVDCNTSRYCNTSFPSITEAIPFVTPFYSLTISLPNPSVPPSQALIVINGNIIALCGIDIPSPIHTGEFLNPRILTGFPLCSCYGFGIVRGIDMEKRAIYINTPLPVSIMQSVNCLVGCIPVPQALLQLNQPGVPYSGVIDALPTSREPRRGCFYVKYQNRQSL